MGYSIYQGHPFFQKDTHARAFVLLKHCQGVVFLPRHSALMSTCEQNGKDNFNE